MGLCGNFTFYSLEIVPVTVKKKNCFGKIFAYKTHPNFGSNFKQKLGIS